MLCSGPEGLERADLNVTMLWAAIQVLQSFITWINEPSQINTPHYWPFWFPVQYAKLVDPMEENGNSKWSCTCCCCFVPKINFCNRDTTCRSYYSKNHSMTVLWDRLCLLQRKFVAVKAVKGY